MEKSKIIIPCHWNKDVLRQIAEKISQTTDIKIKEIYESLSKGIIGHRRSPSSVIDISRKDAVNFKNMLIH